MFVQCLKANLQTINEVAIPFSSGLCSFGSVKWIEIPLHRVAIPFSSGLCSFCLSRDWQVDGRHVAIPFSSGLCSFREGMSVFRVDVRRNPFFIRSVFVQAVGSPSGSPLVSQSLFHQVCVRSRGCLYFVWMSRRNPFFIRSVFVLPVSGRGFFLPCRRNPFFIRSVFVQGTGR